MEDGVRRRQGHSFKQTANHSESVGPGFDGNIPSVFDSNTPGMDLRIDWQTRHNPLQMRKI
eukprot:9468387-Pyramimonas_sp.AAC.1